MASDIYFFSFACFVFSLPVSEWHVKSDKAAVQGGRSTGRIGSETKPRLQRQSRTLSPHPDSSEALCWIMIPQCIATASVLSFPISPVPKAHMETVWSHCVTVYAKSLGSLHRDLGLLRSALPSSSQTALVVVLLFKKAHHLSSGWLEHGRRSFRLRWWAEVGGTRSNPFRRGRSR